MHKRLLTGVIAGAAMLALNDATQAQLFFGTTTTAAGNPSGIYLDVATSTTTTLWNVTTNRKVNGAAADVANGKLYVNDAARLNIWNYGSVGTAPSAIAGMYRTNDNVTFTATGVDGLAWANGQLYGATSFGSTVYDRGIYRINTIPDGMPTPHCVMTPIWLDPTGVGTSSGEIKLEGLDYNASDGLFYAAQTADNTGTGGTYTPGIWTVDAFGGGTLNKIANFPAGQTRVDGLAIGGGKIWLTEQIAGDSKVYIFPFDLTTQTYDPTISFNLTDASNRASGATWAPGALVAVPEPASVAVIGLASGLLLRRRKQ